MSQNKHRLSYINNAMRRDRIADKVLENSSKPHLRSDDVVKTIDFVFLPIRPFNHDGDSGQLLLAKSKSNKKQQYLVKHTYTDCAANEFVYTKLAQAMGLKMPDAVLFQLSEDEKRNYFETEYIIGLEYLDIEIKAPTYHQIRERANNWQDYFRFLAMYKMFLEGDSFETPLVADGFIYRVDITDSFLLSDIHFSHAGLNVVTKGVNAKDVIREYVQSIQYHRLWEIVSFDEQMHSLKEKYGEEDSAYFLEPFAEILEIPDYYIDGFLNTLCYFYPDFIGDYFKSYISALQEKSCEYLKSVN